MIDGSILIGSETRRTNETFAGRDAASGATIGPAFCEAGAADVADACALAAAAAPAFAALSPEGRAAFLERAGEEILAIGDVLIETAMAESGLSRPRLEGERMRTVNQLRLFAAEVRQGYWLDATIDPALPERAPPRSDLRRVNLAIGPVAVFGASNFPLAFSVAGGDAASAFAAGCPVVVKGHPAHPGTGELVARAMARAVTECCLPEGVFSYLPGTGNALGASLVGDPRIKAVGFTGSRSGGLALVRLAQQRLEPIPVYAEMSSINPVVLLPGALAENAEALGAAFVASLTLGAGQFCTNPGLVLAIDAPDLDRFVAAAAQVLERSAAQTMLTAGIAEAYAKGVAALDANAAVRRVAGAPGSGGALFETTAAKFVADAALGHEVFGASSVLVRCAHAAELSEVVAALEGQLTATLHTGTGDDAAAAEILPRLAERCGRVLANGWPTGVEVTRAMVHGGPFPATSDSRSTSVGTMAMSRFLRPVCYQDIPDPLLPPPLQAANPWRIPRRVEGEWTSN
ncbi:aldehyde dehydrogenase (NADP(+)) [Sphingomonas tabacisoli]|uniref:Aldehyde dehydrogenase (NADP(+)) n=1 Tax=Sphingomonas tabacisoli TaxID=2249466 RepID=A0ABW4I1D5_9SPHN